MRARLLAPACLFLVLGNAPVFAAPPVPEKKEEQAATKEQLKEAEEHFFKGVDLYNEQDFAGAILEFRKAHDVVPDYRVLFNLGQACYQAQNYACALDAFQRYLDGGGKKIEAKRRADVEKDIAKLKGRVASVHIVTTPAGASVSIDDEPIGTSPFDKPFVVSQGKRKFTATKEGSQPETRVVEIAGGEETKVELTLREIRKELPPPPPPPPAPKKSPVPMIAAWGVTGAAAIAAVITGAVALSASDEASAELGKLPGDPGRIQDAQSRASTFAAVTDVLVVTAVVGAGVATAFTILTLKPSPAREQGAFVSPRVGIGPGAIVLGGRF
jgi:tetratricopeptide (TPR) repeat protein